MLEDVYKLTKESMDKSIDSLKREYRSIRTGKVTVSILDGIKIDYYGTPTNLSQVASVLSTDATTISISPWEKNLVGDIEKAINEANIGVNPNNDGESVKLFFPPMTVEQRKENAKIAKSMTDTSKVAIRNIRKISNDKIKNLHKEKEINDDENKKGQDEIQKITDSFIKIADDTLSNKEKEILTV
jgi:ribosome recycling factor